MKDNTQRVEPILKLVSALMVFFTLVLIGVEWGFNNDSQVFQVFAGILTGFTGAFLMRIKPAQQSTMSSGDTAVHIPSDSPVRVQINPDTTASTSEPNSPQKEQQ